MLEEVRDLQEPAEPAPVVKNVLKGVQRLEHERIFFSQGVEAQALPGSPQLAIQGALGNSQGNAECLFIPGAAGAIPRSAEGSAA